MSNSGAILCTARKLKHPKPSIISLNETDTCVGYDFNIDIIKDDENCTPKRIVDLV
jgi:hypothetical protein